MRESRKPYIARITTSLRTSNTWKSAFFCSVLQLSPTLALHPHSTTSYLTFIGTKLKIMIWPAALLLVGGVCAISSPFNATVRFRIDALSPMVNLTLLSQLGVTTWRYSEELGMIWSAPKLKDSYGDYYRPGSGRRDYERVPSELNFDFVGTGLEIEGQIGAGTSRSVDVYLWIEGNEWASDQYSNLNKKFKLAPWSVNTPYYTLMRETLSDGPWPYHGRLKVPFGLDFRFVCMWFYVPVRTQA